jgi:hypothetical protein
LSIACLVSDRGEESEGAQELTVLQNKRARILHKKRKLDQALGRIEAQIRQCEAGRQS